MLTIRLLAIWGSTQGPRLANVLWTAGLVYPNTVTLLDLASSSGAAAIFRLSCLFVLLSHSVVYLLTLHVSFVRSSQRRYGIYFMYKECLKTPYPPLLVLATKDHLTTCCVLVGRTRTIPPKRVKGPPVLDIYKHKENMSCL